MYFYKDPLYRHWLMTHEKGFTRMKCFECTPMRGGRQKDD